MKVKNSVRIIAHLLSDELFKDSLNVKGIRINNSLAFVINSGAVQFLHNRKQQERTNHGKAKES